MTKTLPKKQGVDFERPLVTVDLAIFSVSDSALHVLLVRRPDEVTDPFPGRWALPGGFVDLAKDQSLLDCAIRKLREKTGVQSPYLEQLGSWGNAQRDPRGWSATHAYFALIQGQGEELKVGQLQGTALTQWFKVSEAKQIPLAFDHAEILEAAIARLQSKVEYTSLPAFLLEEPFTLPQLQQSYETVLSRPLDKSAFRKRMLDAQFLEESGSFDGPLGRVAMGYRIKDRQQATTFPRPFKTVGRSSEDSSA